MDQTKDANSDISSVSFHFSKTFNFQKEVQVVLKVTTTSEKNYLQPVLDLRMFVQPDGHVTQVLTFMTSCSILQSFVIFPASFRQSIGFI